MSIFDSGLLIKQVKTENGKSLGGGVFSFGTLIDLRGNEKCPEALTVFCSFLDTQEYSPSPGLFLVCDFGASKKMEVDVCQGVVFSLIASSLRVELRSAPKVSTGVNLITVAVAPGIRAAQYPPTRTLPTIEGGSALIAAGATGGEMAIPPFARGVTPIPRFSTATTIADYVLRQKEASAAAGGNSISMHPYMSAGFMSGPRVPLHKDATHLDVVNVDGANNIIMAYSFDLAA